VGGEGGLRLKVQYIAFGALGDWEVE